MLFFSGTAQEFTDCLRGLSQLGGPMETHLVLHEGVGRAKSPIRNTGKTCDWELHFCWRDWHNLGVLLRQGTNSVEVIQRSAGWVCDVHFWSGGRIRLAEVEIPKNIQVTKSTRRGGPYVFD